MILFCLALTPYGSTPRATLSPEGEGVMFGGGGESHSCLARQAGHQRQFLGAGQAAGAGGEGGGHVVAAVGAVFDAQRMADLVQQHREQVHLALGGAAGRGGPELGVAGGEEIGVVHKPLPLPLGEGWGSRTSRKIHRPSAPRIQ